MGIRINGNTDNISATDGGLTISDLEINQSGISTFNAGVGIGDSIFHLGDADTQIRFPADDTITAETGGSERLRIDSSGRIGIGITNPDAYQSSSRNLVIGKASDAAGITIRTGTSNGGYIRFADGTSGNQAYRGTVAYVHDGDYMMFATDSTEKLRITSNGTIGIGIANPVLKMHLHEASSGNNYIKFTNTTTGSAETDGVHLGLGSDEAFNINQRESNDIRLFTAATERLRIASAGQIGLSGSNYGSAGQVLTSGGPSSAAVWKDQTDVLDMWQLSADVTNSDNTVRFFDLGDWTQKTGDPYANLGYIGAYENQGIFRMPSTGYYEITAIIGWNIYNATSKSCANAIYTTTDNSSYTQAVKNVIHTGGGQSGTNQSTNIVKLFWKVNNISNDKFKISYTSFNTNPYIESETTYLYIKKLRDL